MSMPSRRELERTKLDLRQWSQRLLAISQELTLLAADLSADRGDDEFGGRRPGQPRRPGR